MGLWVFIVRVCKHPLTKSSWKSAIWRGSARRRRTRGARTRRTIRRAAQTLRRGGGRRTPSGPWPRGASAGARAGTDLMNKFKDAIYGQQKSGPPTSL
jgi:hypothetical protein